MWSYSRCTHLLRGGRPLSLAALSLFTSTACQDSPTEPEQAEVSAPSLAVGSNRWVTRVNMPSDRVEVTTAVVTNPQGRTILYVIGGRSPGAFNFCTSMLSKVQAYDPVANTWSTKAPFPGPIASTNGAGVIDGKIYLTGECDAQASAEGRTWMYDPAGNTWTEKALIPRDGRQGNTGVINNQLYVLTGCDGGHDCGTFTNVFFGRYDPPSNTWSSLPLPPSGTGHVGGGSAVIGGRFYVVGGDGGPTVEVYDPATNKWSTRAALGLNRYGVASAAVAGKLYLIAGTRWNADDSRTAVGTTSVYDPATNTWTNLAPSPRTGNGLGAGRIVVEGKPRIALVGGARPGNNLQYVP
jgi:N-acetylneuraminic acid mutarotase